MESPDGLAAACFELARTAKWARRPIDTNEIAELAARFTAIAREKVCDGLDIDLALIERAVRYITQVHGMPMGDDTDWFEYMLTALLEVARPNGSVDARSKTFLHDMMSGIRDSLADE